MKRKYAAWLLLLAAIVVALPLVHEKTPMIYSYDRNEDCLFTADQVRVVLVRTSEELDMVKANKSFPRTMALDIELRCEYLMANVQSKYADAFSVVATEGASDIYWETYTVQVRAADFRKLYMSPQDQKLYDDQFQEQAKKVIRFKPYPERYYLYKQIIPRTTLAGLFLLTAALLQIVPLIGQFRKLFSRSSLNICGYTIALAVSVCSTPAVAQVLLSKIKKETQRTEQVENPGDAANPALPLKRFEFKTETFADVNHNNGKDRQQLTSVFARINKRLSLAFVNQFRQELLTGNDLEVPAVGLRFNVTKNAALVAVSGPEWDNIKTTNNIWKRKFATTFVVFAYNPPEGSYWKPQILSINRFPVETDSGYSGTHRHIAASRAGPMPKWLMLQIELKWSRGSLVENFWGAMVSIGQFVKGKSRSWLGGLYVYPYYDFRTTWNVRVGYIKTFAIQ